MVIENSRFLAIYVQGQVGESSETIFFTQFLFVKLQFHYYFLFILSMYLKEAPLHFSWLLLSEGEVQAIMTYIIICHIASLRGLSAWTMCFTLISLITRISLTWVVQRYH